MPDETAQECIGLVIAMRPAGDDGEAISGCLAHFHRPPGEQSGSGNVGAPCFGSATRLLADEDAAERRCIDDAQNRSPVLDKCNIDGELAVAADEFLGAVERI